MGKTKVTRVRLRCQRCGKEAYPLDTAICLEGDSATVGVKERVLWASVEVGIGVFKGIYWLRGFKK